MALSTSQVAFYGADTVDYLNGVAAAEALTVSPLNVTGSFDTAANWSHAGSYFVIAVGGPAANALYWNPCGWYTSAFSSTACTTPLNRYSYPYDGAIAADYFMPADGSDRISSLQLAVMLGYYALHGIYPSNMCPLPLNTETATCPTCAGSSTNSCPTTS
jgi:hypothetical protein